jgi:hypothetical protein
MPSPGNKILVKCSKVVRRKYCMISRLILIGCGNGAKNHTGSDSDGRENHTKLKKGSKRLM